MKHFHLLFIAFVFVSMNMSAAVVEPERALEVAQSFLPTNSKIHKSPKGSSAPIDAEIVYTHYMPKSHRPAIYVVNIGHAFALVSADDVAHPILGYNYSKSWPTDGNLPPQVKSFLDDLAAQMEAASEHPQDTITAAEWNAPRRMSRRAKMDNLPDSVGPLLTTTWDQGQYYNAMCPVDESGPNGHCLTGCVATAMAQIINYWGQRQPIHTRGIHSYQSNYGELRVNYDSTSYDFAHMPNQLTDASTQQEKDAVAKLMYECGVAVNMRFGTGESAASSYDIRGALTNYFNFSSHQQYLTKDVMYEEEWHRLTKNNLLIGKPLMYGGKGNSGAHLFICDGYTRNDFYHFNFGWGGDFDGWFQVSSIEPHDGLSYTLSQLSIIDIIPNSVIENVLYTQESCGQHSVFSISEKFDLMGIVANNEYNPLVNSLTDLRGLTITFTAQDTTKQLVLNILGENYSDTKIYDGENIEDSLLWDSDNASETGPIVSTKHSLTIKKITSVFQDFHYLVTVSEGCNKRTRFNTISADTTTVHLSWESDDADQWDIVYGLKGFSPLEGSPIRTSSPSLEISHLQPFTDYDFYVRPICEGGVSGLWSASATISTIAHGGLWTNLVNEQPQGFFEDEDGNICISSAEGLAWLSKSQRTFEGRVVRLTEDINLEAHLWKPIPVFKGVFDGGGHFISGMTVIADSLQQSGGLITQLAKGAIVKNTNIVNCFMRAEHSDIAGIALNAEDAKIINCFVSGTVFSHFRPAGIVAKAENTQIVNCAVNGSILGSSDAAGICSYMSHGFMRNCYTSASVTDICKDNPNSEVSHCYSYYYRCHNQLNPYISTYEGYKYALSPFIRKNGEWILKNPVIFNGDTCTRLIDALNQGIKEQTTTGLKLWVLDSLGINEGFPILSNLEYIPACPHIKSVKLKAVDKNGNLGIAVSWPNYGNSEMYEIRCCRITNQLLVTLDTVQDFTTFNTTDTIWNLVNGEQYVVQVRPICDSHNKGAWSEREKIIIQILWKDIITSLPPGYKVASNNEIYISSAEGLAWLISVVNGENGLPKDNLKGRVVHLMSDVNIGKYSWTPLYNFCGLFDGHNHQIDSLTIMNNEKDDQGFFSNTSGASIVNLSFNDATVQGHNRVATICGGSNDNLFIKNCRANSFVLGYSYVGGLVAVAKTSSTVDQCASYGEIFSSSDIAGGLVASIYDEMSPSSHSGIIRNSNSQCDIYTNERLLGGLCGMTGSAIIENCYSLSNLSGFGWYAGLIGEAHHNTIIKNCYTSFEDNPGYLISKHSPSMALIADALGQIYLSNVYYPQNQTIPTVWSEHPQSTTFVCTDTTGYDLSNQTYPLERPISINNKNCTTLLSALNDWVDAQDANSYEYLHWVEDTTNYSGLPVLISSNEKSKYRIEFRDQDGTILNIDSLEYGCIPTYQSNFNITEETDTTFTYFAGWSPTMEIVTGDKTYTATYRKQWKKFIISFLDEDNTLLQVDTLDYGAMPVFRGDLSSKEGTSSYTYSFDGWYPQLAPIKEYVTYRATYRKSYSQEPAQCTVIFLDIDGTEIQRQTVAYNSEIIMPWPPREDDWAFLGWFCNGDIINAQQTYKVTEDVYCIAQYKLWCAFMTWDGIILETNWLSYGERPIYSGSTPTRPSDDDCSYIFSGWTPEVPLALTMPSWFTANYISNCERSTITFVNYDGSVLEERQWPTGTTPSYEGATPTRPASDETSFIFVGWTPEIMPVTGDATYMATFIEVGLCTVVFLDIDSTELRRDIVEYGSTTEPIYPPRDDGWVFQGWLSDEGQLITDISQYAITKPFQYLIAQYKVFVAFTDWNGVWLAWDNVPYGQRPTYNGQLPTRQDDDEYSYIFSGWTPEIPDSLIMPTIFTAVYTQTPKSPTRVDSAATHQQPIKLFHDGHIYILRGDKIYTIHGQIVK